jgi:hypothetical protein
MLLVGTTKKGFLSHRKVGISEQVIASGELANKRSVPPETHSLGTKTPWSLRHNPDLNTEVKVGVVHSEKAEEASIIVYYKTGAIEVLS